MVNAPSILTLSVSGSGTPTFSVNYLTMSIVSENITYDTAMRQSSVPERNAGALVQYIGNEPKQLDIEAKYLGNASDVLQLPFYFFRIFSSKSPISVSWEEYDVKETAWVTNSFRCMPLHHETEPNQIFTIGNVNLSFKIIS